MSSWLDKFPLNERQRLREKYKMSAAAYEKLRQRVKGPEDLEREMAKNELLAQLKLGLETEPELKNLLKQQIESDLQEQGIEACLTVENLPADVKQHLEQGQFAIMVESNSDSQPDQLVVQPEGNIGEALALNTQLSDTYLAQFADMG